MVTRAAGRPAQRAVVARRTWLEHKPSRESWNGLCSSHVLRARPPPAASSAHARTTFLAVTLRTGYVPFVPVSPFLRL